MAAQNRPTLHLVVFAFPGHGHITAILDFSRALFSAAANVFLSFVSTENAISQMQAKGFSAGELPIRLVGLSDGLPSIEGSVDRIDQIQVIIDSAEQIRKSFESWLDSLIEDAARKQSERPACIIYDNTFWWVCEVSKKRSIPGYSFFPMSASFLSFLLLFPDLVSQGRLPFRSDSDVAATSSLFDLPAFPSLHPSELPDIAWDPNPVCKLEILLRGLSCTGEASGILINTIYELEKDTIEFLKQAVEALDIRAVGPVLPPSFVHRDFSADTLEQLTAADRECLEWLDLQPSASVLYVAFGTIASLPSEQIHELAIGLEASDHRFLWVVRLSRDQEMEVDSVLPEGFEERIKERGKVMRGWAPQRSVLRHRATGGFMTHCGWNSTLESLCCGIPILCWPIFMDQPMNCKFLEKVLEVGKTVRKPGRTSLVGRKEVSDAVRLLMDDKNPSGKQLRMKASRLKQTAGEAMLPGGSSYDAIRGFLQKITPATKHSED